MAEGWSKHYQSEWQLRAGNPSLPQWLRVASVAYGGHRANGHCPLARGDLAAALSSVDMETGEIRTPERANVNRAIKTAIEYGFLDRRSSAQCLIVPEHAISGGLGSPYAPCHVHKRVSQ